jgi:hypothetical protein
MGMTDLTPQEQAQVKAKYGIQPDVQGMALKHQEQHNAPAVEHEHEIIKQKDQQQHEKEMAMIDALSNIGGDGVGGKEPLGAPNSQ